MSSRLFQKIREEEGLCYSVYSYDSLYKAAGMLSIYAAFNMKNAKKTIFIPNFIDIAPRNCYNSLWARRTP